MSTLKSNNENMTINADGASSEIILQQNGTEIGRIGSGFAGTSGQVLTSNGAGSAPTMQAGGDVTPSFLAYLGSNQNINNGTWTNVSYDTELYDTDNCFASSQFTPTTAGYYFVATNTRVSQPPADKRMIVRIRKNEADATYHQVHSSYAADFSSSHATIVYMNGTTDYLDVQAYHATGSTEVLLAGIALNNFYAYKLLGV